MFAAQSTPVFNQHYDTCLLSISLITDQRQRRLWFKNTIFTASKIYRSCKRRSRYVTSCQLIDYPTTGDTTSHFLLNTPDVFVVLRKSWGYPWWHWRAVATPTGLRFVLTNMPTPRKYDIILIALVIITKCCCLMKRALLVRKLTKSIIPSWNCVIVKY